MAARVRSCCAWQRRGESDRGREKSDVVLRCCLSRMGDCGGGFRVGMWVQKSGKVGRWTNWVWCGSGAAPLRLWPGPAQEKRGKVGRRANWAGKGGKVGDK